MVDYSSPLHLGNDSGHSVFARTPDGTDIPTNLTDQEVHVLKILSLAFSAVSVILALIAFYWFTRMRRSFRHDLIMLLIQSDMFKALWFMIYPLVDFIHGPIPSSSAFCQASGFFLAIGIEASDIAVLLIAIHTALYIFRPRRAGGEYGLYPYRRWAYATFFCFPVLMATLAFVNQPGYVNVGEFCYLPLRPAWTRTALSWAPRYAIFLTILVIYACIYTHVSMLIKRFGRLAARSERSATGRQGHGLEDSSGPHVPPPAYRSSLPPSRRQSGDSRGRQGSLSTLGSLKFEVNSSGQSSSNTISVPAPHGQIQWKLPNFDDPQPSAPSSSGHMHSDADSEPPVVASGTNSRRGSDDIFAPLDRSGGPPLPPLLETPTLPTSEPADASTQHTDLPPWEAPPANPIPIRTLAPERLSCSSTASSGILPSPIADLSGMAKTREKIRHQLRLLFIYPLVYMVIWIMPFASHVVTSDEGDDDAPFGLLVVSLVSLCIQGAVNSLLFSIREKPWRHLKSSSDRGRGGRMPLWPLRGDAAEPRRKRGQPAVGRTREEMRVDGRIARMRLQVEIEERKRREAAAARRGSRQWWDLVDVDVEAGQTGDDETLLH